MKDDKPKGKPQKDQAGQGIAASQTPSSQKEHAAEDVDFEILDALEQIEHTGKGKRENLSEEDDFALSLDGEDMLFDEDETDEEAEFRFDESLTAGLEEELTGDTGEFNLDATLGEEPGEDVHANFEDDAFSLDLDQQEEDLEGADEFSFDTEMDLDSKGEQGEEEFSFDTDIDLETKGEQGADEISFDTDLDLEAKGETEEPAFDLGNIGGMEFTPDADAAAEAVTEREADAAGLLDFGEDAGEDFALDGDLSHQERSDLGLDEADEAFGEFDLGDMADSDDELDLAMDAGDDNAGGLEFSATDFADETDEFSGKAVISVGAEQVIDLGNETEFDLAAQTPAIPRANGKVAAPAEAVTESLALAAEQMDAEAVEPEAVTSQIAARLVSAAPTAPEPATETPTAEEQTEEFEAALEEMDIDLEEETTKVLETLAEPAQFAELTAGEPADFEAADFETPLDDASDQEPTAEAAVTVAAEMAAKPLLETVAEQEEEVVAAPAPAAMALPETAETAELQGEEPAELGLALRLGASEVQKFASRVQEAGTLQHYVDELNGHKANIKEKIYQKLLKEYTSRKTNLFREPEFISIRIDVEEDLQDMLARRAELAATIDRLNDELEEVQVRHLVGEYTDALRAEREAAQRQEIAEWQAKTRHIEKFITRYQELLETERTLNPPEKEALPTPAAPKESSPAPKIAAPREAVKQAEEAYFAEDLAATEAAEETEPSAAEAEEAAFMADLAATEAAAETEPSAEEVEEAAFMAELAATEAAAETEPSAAEAEEAAFMADLAAEENLFSAGALPGEDAFQETEAEDFGLAELPEMDEDFMDEDLDEAPAALESPAVVAPPAAFAAEPEQAEPAQEDMIACKKCKRLTPAAEKFCVNCGAKAR